MEVERIKRSVFEGLPEYSMSNPTGVRFGKVWRSLTNWRDPNSGWVVCEYVRTDDPEMARIEVRKAEIVEG